MKMRRFDVGKGRLTSPRWRYGTSTVISTLLHVVITLIVVGSFFGCAARTTGIEGGPVLLPSTEQLIAAAAEDDGEYRAALQYWRQAREKIDARIEEISRQLRRVSQWYAEIGVRFYQDKKGKKALAEFIEALRYNPENTLALEYFKNKYIPLRWISYTVQENDTISSIAEAFYQNAADGFVIVHCAGIGDEEGLTAGTEIRLPRLDSFFSPQLQDYKSDILHARALYTEKDFAKLLPVAEKILASHPGDEEASYLLGSALVGLGEELRRRQRYEKAIEVLSRVDPLFKDVKRDIAQIHVLQMQQRADNTQALNDELFARAKTLLENEKYLQARSVLEEIDPGVAGVREVVADLHTILKEQADIHYKRGVTFFVDDNLAAAIDMWQKTLRYDPGHEQAAANIAKARSLLEKVKSID